MDLLMITMLSIVAAAGTIIGCAIGIHYYCKRLTRQPILVTPPPTQPVFGIPLSYRASSGLDPMSRAERAYCGSPTHF